VEGRACGVESGIDAVGVGMGGVEVRLRRLAVQVGARRVHAGAGLQRLVNPRARTRSHRTESGFIVVSGAAGQKGAAATRPTERNRGGARSGGSSNVT
jgi:hypothetical protein